MSELKADLRLEIAHVLFIDVVGSSKLLINEQSDVLRALNEIVRSAAEVRSAEAVGKLIQLPTGDGMALAFFTTPDAPVRCAVEISKAVKNHPNLALRMGINSGPVDQVVDVNERSNIAGAGITIAQRVMDCGDAGHIFLSKRIADDLAQYSQWQSHLHELGQCEVKHGVKIDIVNLYTDEIGNSKLPEKLRQQNRQHAAGQRLRRAMFGGSVLVAIALLLTSLFFWRRAVPEKSLLEKSIAVLPFESLSKDEENAFFAGGVQDEILSNLAKIADLKVISRTSVMQYKNTATRNLREIAQQLGVGHILEGSVQRSANRIRVTAQLIDARTDTHLWAEHYDRELADIFAVQSEIAQKIADQLQAKISPRETAAIAAAPTTDLSANALYVQAKELELKTPEHQSLLEAVRLLDQAVARDPHFLLAYCMLGRLHLTIFFGGYDHTPARRELANAAIQNAVRLQPDAGEVHLALARYAYHGFRDYDHARAELDLARSTLPNDVDVFFLSALIDRRQGRWTEATRNFERAIALDPRNLEFLLNAGDTYQNLRRYSESRPLFERALAISPREQGARIGLASQPFLERGDIRPLRAEVSAILTEEPAAQLADVLFHCAIFERDSTTANRALAAIPSEGTLGRGNFVYPREWFAGVAARTFNDPAGARTSFTAARGIVEKIVHDQPDYAPAWSLLGRIDSALGRKEEAVREGRRACELMPLSKDAAFGAAFIANLAVVYAWTGEKDLALETLATTAQLPNGVKYGDLKLHPQWDSLRDDPRFEKIVASLAPKQ